MKKTATRLYMVIKLDVGY